MAKNYYVILGVDSGATQEQIKSAYRQQVKKYHPDHYGKDSEPFLDVQEAYEVLSDPGRRCAYDAELARERRTPRGVRPEPVRPRRSPFDPFPSAARRTTLGDLLFDLSFRASPLSFQEIFDRLWSDFRRPARPSAAGVEDVNVEISLTPVQALRGGRVRVWVPVETECPTCWGWGSIGRYACQDCAGTGSVAVEYPVLLSFPGGISHHHTMRVPLGQLGLPHLYLTVHFKVTP